MVLQQLFCFQIPIVDAELRKAAGEEGTENEGGESDNNLHFSSLLILSSLTSPLSIFPLATFFELSSPNSSLLLPSTLASSLSPHLIIFSPFPFYFIPHSSLSLTFFSSPFCRREASLQCPAGHSPWYLCNPERLHGYPLAQGGKNVSASLS